MHKSLISRCAFEPPSGPHQNKEPPHFASYNLHLCHHNIAQGMFSSSVRRVAFKAPQSPIASLAGSVPRAASQASYRCHQRRFSSSKPSNPADGSNPFNPAKRQALPTSESPTKSALPATEVVAPDSLSAEKKSQRAGKRKGKIVDSSSKIENRLPSVPSTHHIRPESESKIGAFQFSYLT